MSASEFISLALAGYKSVVVPALDESNFRVAEQQVTNLVLGLKGLSPLELGHYHHAVPCLSRADALLVSFRAREPPSRDLYDAFHAELAQLDLAMRTNNVFR